MNQTEIAQVMSDYQPRLQKLMDKLGRPHLEMLLKAASVVDVPAERALFRDRTPVDFLYFVLDGSLSAYIENEGLSKKIGTIGAGEWIGEVSVLSGESQATATVIADTACRVLKMHRIAFESLIDDNEAISRALLDQFIELMAARLRKPMTSVAV
jgi:CRP-like cAMP-binding protein